MSSSPARLVRSSPTSRQPGPATSGNYAMHIRDMIEAFLIKLKRGTYASSSADRSQTIGAALEACAILRTIIEHYADYVRERGGVLGFSSPTKRGLQPSFSMGFASSANLAADDHGLSVDRGELPPGVREVTEVITQLSKVGRTLQRASAFRLLLANVTRRVLFIVRESAATAVTTMADLEAAHISEAEAAGGYGAVDVTSNSASECSEEATTTTGAKGDRNEAAFQFDDESPAAAAGTGGKHVASHGVFPAVSAPAIVSKDEDAVGPSGRRSIFARPGSGSGATADADGPDLMDHTPPTDTRLLPRVESSINPDSGAHGVGSGVATTSAVLAFGEPQPIDFIEFVDKTLTGIGFLEVELEKMTSSLCDHAAKQLYNGEVVLTLGCSHTLINFLLTAAASKTFQVIILEGAPLDSSEPMVRALEEKGIATRVLPDSSCWAVMSKASKVFISTNNVLANGGLLAPIGTHPLCLAAKQFSVPVITVTISLKLCPYYPSDPQCSSLVKISKTEAQEVPWSMYESPHDVLPHHAMHEIDRGVCHDLVVDNPITEYVPPHLISLFVTNDGEYTVPQVHRLVRDHYHIEDGHV